MRQNQERDLSTPPRAFVAWGSVRAACAWGPHVFRWQTRSEMAAEDDKNRRQQKKAVDNKRVQSGTQEVPAEGGRTTQKQAAFGLLQAAGGKRGAKDQGRWYKLHGHIVTHNSTAFESLPTTYRNLALTVAKAASLSGQPVGEHPRTYRRTRKPITAPRLNDAPYTTSGGEVRSLANRCMHACVENWMENHCPSPPENTDTNVSSPEGKHRANHVSTAGEPYAQEPHGMRGI